MVTKNMNKSTLVLSISHPNMDPKLITDNLKLKPNVSQKYGEDVTTPKGVKTHGKYRLTKWTHIVNLSRGNEHIYDELGALVNHLYETKDFLQKLNKDDGACALYLNLSDPENFAFLMPLGVMRKMMDLEITFGFEIFRN